jgi:hypothetical protein
MVLESKEFFFFFLPPQAEKGSIQFEPTYPMGWAIFSSFQDFNLNPPIPYVGPLSNPTWM